MVSSSQPTSYIQDINPLVLTSTNMSAINTSTSFVNRSSERVGAGLVNGYQWKPAHGLGLISRTSIMRPTNDRFGEGPYLSCEQVGTWILRLLWYFLADTGLDCGDGTTPSS
jgi:hypothetical protein